MGNSVEIVAKTLEAISGTDPEDPATFLIPPQFEYNFSDAIKNETLEGKRFGLLNIENTNPIIVSLHDEIRRIIESLGGEVVEIVDNRVYPDEEEYYILLYEFKVGLEEYLEKSISSNKTLEEIIKFNEANKELTMPYFGQDIFYQSLESTNYLRYLWSKRAIKNSYKKTLSLMKKFELDAFIGITRGPAWKINYQDGDWGAMQETILISSGGYAAHNGMPHITIPYFEINNMPVGISIIGRRWDDKLIIEPLSESIIAGMQCFMPKNTPSRLIDCCFCQSSRVISTMLPPMAIPALLTSTFSPPHCSRVWATTVSHSLSLVTSCFKKKELPPVSLMSVAVCCPRSSCMSVNTTVAPSSASRRQTPRPIPDAPPETNATLPLNRPNGLSLLSIIESCY